MHLNHPENTPPPLVREKLSSMKPVCGAEEVGDSCHILFEDTLNRFSDTTGHSVRACTRGGSFDLQLYPAGTKV